jgi:hypothetical protein
MKRLTTTSIFMDAVDAVLDTVDVIRVPAFGTNNGFQFHQSAAAIAYGAVTCVDNITKRMDQKTDKPLRIEFIVKMGTDSVRVLSHIGNYLAGLRIGKEQDDLCTGCKIRNKSIVFGECLERVVCYPCATNLCYTSESQRDSRSASDDVCPSCKTPINSNQFLFVPTTIDCSTSPCTICKKDGEKQDGIFVPCGHMGSVCAAAECIAIANALQQCPTCNNKTMYKHK